MLVRLRQRLQRLARTTQENRHSLVGPPELWRMKRDFQIQFLEESGLLPHHTLLDIGCGTLRGGIPLIEYLDAGHYCGIEARAEVLAEGQRELADSGLIDKKPTLLVRSELSDLELDRSFDFVWAYSVFMHMEDEILSDALDLAARSMATGGVLYANVRVGQQREGRWQGFPVLSRSLAFYAEACAASGLELTDLGTMDELGHRSGSQIQDRQRMLRITPHRPEG